MGWLIGRAAQFQRRAGRHLAIQSLHGQVVSRVGVNQLAESIASSENFTSMLSASLIA
jgi:hypothetical protein